MARNLPSVVVLFVLLFVPVSSRAQERGRIGVTMGFPPAVGFIWHVSDRLAVRPEVTLTNSSTETGSGLTDSTSDNRAVNAGASVLWYFAGTDNVRPYFSPQIVFGHTSRESSGIAAGPTTDTIGVSGSFGAQYSPVRKFSVYGEVGYGFSRGSSEITAPFGSSKSTFRSWSTTSSVGVIFYFGRT